MLQNIYDQMWSDYQVAIKHNKLEIDSNIDKLNDTRRGITSLSYLNAHSPELIQEIYSFQNLISQIAPEQYYYPVEEMHLTILSIISCTEGFKLSDINTEMYKHVFMDVFRSQPPIDIEFRGITASPSCIVIQGFPLGNGLQILRDKLRDQFGNSGLRSSCDSRYKLVTAHSTVIRFRSPTVNNQRLLALCEKYREHNFGTITLTRFELVFNDWYQRLSNSISLSRMYVAEGCPRLASGKSTPEVS